VERVEGECAVGKTAFAAWNFLHQNDEQRNRLNWPAQLRRFFQTLQIRVFCCIRRAALLPRFSNFKLRKNDSDGIRRPLLHARCARAAGWRATQIWNQRMKGNDTNAEKALRAKERFPLFERRAPRPMPETEHVRRAGGRANWTSDVRHAG
jgi:hypothetical protein